VKHYYGIKFTAEITPEAGMVLQWIRAAPAVGWSTAAKVWWHVPWVVIWSKEPGANFIPYGAMVVIPGWENEGQRSVVEDGTWDVICATTSESELQFFCEQILPYMIKESTRVEVRPTTSSESTFIEVSPQLPGDKSTKGITKVVFPQEAMWVDIVEGDENNGVGRIDNYPLSPHLHIGQLITYGGGTDTHRPVFQGLVRKTAHDGDKDNK